MHRELGLIRNHYQIHNLALMKDTRLLWQSVTTQCYIVVVCSDSNRYRWCICQIYKFIQLITVLLPNNKDYLPFFGIV